MPRTCPVSLWGMRFGGLAQRKLGQRGQGDGAVDHESGDVLELSAVGAHENILGLDAPRLALGFVDRVVEIGQPAAPA